jgi:hypothetical protein
LGEISRHKIFVYQDLPYLSQFINSELNYAYFSSVKASASLTKIKPAIARVATHVKAAEFGKDQEESLEIQLSLPAKGALVRKIQRANKNGDGEEIFVFDIPDHFHVSKIPKTVLTFFRLLKYCHSTLLTRTLFNTSELLILRW